MFVLLISFLGLLVPTIVAAPTGPIEERGFGLGIQFGSDKNSLPILKLPYASYRAFQYDSFEDIYYFKNIRFAAPPVGQLRWQKPQPPVKQDGIQDGSYGSACYQAAPQFLSIANPLLRSTESGSEDCLFLDIKVPGAAVRGEVKDLPVLFWLFGGGYTLGSKSFIVYDGQPLLKSAKNSIIYVAPNYRLGAFGWLAGPTVQKDGVVNAGLWDQRAALEWVQSYISFLGGDKTQVTAMGESAGAGSIMHHLTAQHGTVDPLFKRAIVQSPAYQPMYDPKRLEDIFEAFATAAGCDGKGMDCLRSVSASALDSANLKVILAQPYGTFGFGPAVDHSHILDLPSMELGAGNFWKDMSLLIGHNSHEGFLFSPLKYTSNDDVNKLINTNFPNATASVQSTIGKDLYPPPGLFKKYLTNYFRVADLIGQWCVTCNARYLAKAYAGKTWSYRFAIPPGLHAMDILFTFWRTDLHIADLQIDVDLSFFSDKNLATGFQSYLTSFARCGNPNEYRELGGIPSTIPFSKSVVGQNVNALQMDLLGFHTVDDEDQDKKRCDFWQSRIWQ